jgi:hypothetical protein
MYYFVAEDRVTDACPPGVRPRLPEGMEGYLVARPTWYEEERHEGEPLWGLYDCPELRVEDPPEIERVSQEFFELLWSARRYLPAFA